MSSEAEDRLLHAANREGPGNERLTSANVLAPGRYFVAVSVVTSAAGYTLTAFNPDAGANPLPTITLLSPATARANGGGFVLVVTGENYVHGSVVRWNGSDRATTFINETQLSAVIPASDLAARGTAGGTVFNPAPGGGLSNTFSFTITLALQAVPPRGTKDEPALPARNLASPVWTKSTCRCRWRNWPTAA